jgi:PIN domain nuclease of toxin-antitoxin system
LRLLLDTHIWLWLTSDSGRIGKRLIRELRNETNELWVSPISAWEALTLHYKKRIWLGDDLRQWLTQALAGMREAPLTHEIALAARQLEMHKDPADRMLCGTAKVLNLLLVTADEKLLELSHVPTLANR